MEGLNTPRKRKVSKIYKLQRPILFQGVLKPRNYFEGWYYKIVSSDHESLYAIIPGVALNKDYTKSHAFIQILNGTTAEYQYIRFPIDKFSYNLKPHLIEIGPNKFTENMIELELSNEEISLSGKLVFNDNISLPFKKFSPGIMGPLTYLPFLQTYHGIISMNHEIQGNLIINNKKIDYDGGKGYIEKDWGKAFPSEWIWMQSNHFKENRRSFIFSLAKLPYLGIKFSGFLAVLWDKGELFIFTSYNGSKLHIKEISPVSVSFIIKNKKSGITIEAEATKTPPFGDNLTAVMKTPVNGEMINKTAETMSAKIKLHVYSHNRRIPSKKYDESYEFYDTGQLAGLEIMAESRSFK